MIKTLSITLILLESSRKKGCCMAQQRLMQVLMLCMNRRAVL